VDTNDLSIVSADMDEIMTFPYPNYDGNTDGIVDILDLTLVSRNIMKLTQLCSTLSTQIFDKRTEKSYICAFAANQSDNVYIYRLRNSFFFHMNKCFSLSGSFGIMVGDI